VDGKTDPLIIEEMFVRHLGRSPAEGELADILAEYLERLPESLKAAERFRLMPGVPEALESAGELGTLGLATGNVEAAAGIKLRHAGIAQWFEYDGRLLGGFGSDSATRASLTQTAVNRGLAAMGAAERSAVDVFVIGDTPRDVAAARAVGAIAVAVCTGGHDRPSLEETGADVVLADLDELLPWVERRALDASLRVAKMATP
jgi:phosphoglycolate phosphatase-like HAD superfamily hydrolase